MLLRRRVSVRVAVLLFVLSGLASCGGGGALPTGQPSFYQDISKGALLDPAAAASMLSGYRRNHGLPPVSIDPELSSLAQQQAQAMAARNRLSHETAGNFTTRLRNAGYHASAAAENISAGYHTLAEAFSGWRDSRGHRANMLLKGANRMGIAAARAPNSKYKVFWALIIAQR
jgi:uncharacterized protein YkwD